MKWWLLILLLVLATPASSKILIDKLTVVDGAPRLVTLGNLTRSIADSLFDNPVVVTVCVSDHEQEICCHYINNEASYTFNLYNRGD